MKIVLKRITKYLAITAFIATIVLLTNKLVYFFSSINNRNNGSLNSHYYQWKFGKIFYSVTGSGKTVLLIHSLNNGSSSYEFNKIVKTLAKTRTVYVLDLIGFGKSEKPKMTYTAYLYVQLIQDFIKDVVTTNTDIITSGNSNAFITMLALQKDTLINKLIFINPGDINHLSKNPSTKDVILKYILESPLIGTSIYNIISSKFFLSLTIKKKYISNPINYNKKYLNSFYEASHLGQSSNKYVFSSNYCNYNNVNITSALEEINQSIYLIQGSDRTYNYESIIRDYKNLNAAIESSVINRTKEYPHLEKPKSILQVLSIYLH